MEERKKFYVTTAIDYVNAEPHIGHAYQKIIADVIARWHKLKGEKVFFLTGTDEHGQKIAQSAKEAGMSPVDFVNKISKKFLDSWDKLNIKYDRFIRTTDKDHENFVQEFIKEIKNDIYKGFYEGLYCVGCERFYTEKDLNNGQCIFHPGKELKRVREETYYFKLSKYKKDLLKIYKENPNFILPPERRNEIINRVKEGLQDLSITRTNFSWGIPFPLDKKHVVYVWFDALLNYLSGAGKNQEFWPANVHLLGKDNGWFHAVIWPAMLLSAKKELPKTVFIHGFLTFNGQKISKSLGNVVSPDYLVEKYGADSIRYYILRNFVFGEDGDFSEKILIERHNNELADKLGNLVNRVAVLVEKYGTEKTENKLIKNLDFKKIDRLFENYQFDKVLNEIFSFIDRCNEYVQNKRLWETKDKKALFELVECIKEIAKLLSPFIPESSEKIIKQFKLKEIKKSKILFKKF
ncbi:MAG: class I tRNA ligase family protein [Candidatus Pacearchaeota archaeon]